MGVYAITALPQGRVKTLLYKEKNRTPKRPVFALF